MASTTVPPPDQRRRLGVALALYLAVVVVVITLVPFRFAWPGGLRLVGFTTVWDLVSNVVLFVPLGFFVAFSGRGRPAAVAFALSLLVEVLQEAVPGRSPSLLDLGTNTLGGLVGGQVYAWVAALLAARRSRGVFALDLPLLGVVYLTVPLLWLSGIVAAGDPDRRWLAAVLAAAGIPIFAAVARHHLARRGRPMAVSALLAGGWALAGLLPGWYRRPGFLLLLSGLIAVAAGLASALTERLPPDRRRYEVPTLRRAGVALGAYLVLAAVWPLDGLGSIWHAGWSPRGGPASGTAWAILQLVELVGGATVAGYLLAELRGRATEDLRRSRIRIALAGLVLASVLVGLRGFHALHGASIAEAALVAFATMLGGSLYHLQRDYVVSVLAGGGQPADRAAQRVEELSPPATARMRAAST